MLRRALKRSALALASTIVATAFGIALLLAWMKATGAGVERLPLAAVNGGNFVTASFANFLRVLEREDSAVFASVWDANRQAMLSRELFIPTEMFGEQKYRYRPGISVINAHVWTGVGYQFFGVPATPTVVSALDRCESLRSIRFETDEHGFKKTPPVRGRVVFFLGDSFTEGLFMESDSAFASLCGRAMRNVRSVNLGVNGYSPLEMAWMLEKFQPELKPEIAIVNLYPNDVYRDEYAVLDGRIPAREGFEKMFLYLDRMKAFCEAKGIRLVVSMIPAKEQLHRPETEERFQVPVKEWAKAKRVESADPLPFFRTIGKERIYFDWDPHFSEEGHRHYAAFLAQSLGV